MLKDYKIVLWFYLFIIIFYIKSAFNHKNLRIFGLIRKIIILLMTMTILK